MLRLNPTTVVASNEASSSKSENQKKSSIPAYGCLAREIIKLGKNYPTVRTTNKSSFGKKVKIGKIPLFGVPTVLLMGYNL